MKKACISFSVLLLVLFVSGMMNVREAMGQCPPEPFPPGCECRWEIDNPQCKTRECAEFCQHHYYGGHGHCISDDTCQCKEPCG